MTEYPDPVYVLTLVHGTVPPLLGRWLPPDQSFTSATSGFVKRLRCLLNAPVIGVPFVWTGENSHAARRSAGADLADHLRAVLELHPRAKHFLIAHSHGGNVCLYALRDPDLRRRINGVVCLATPSIHVQTREIADTLTVVTLFLRMILLIFGFTVGLFVIGLALGMLLELLWPHAPEVMGYVNPEAIITLQNVPHQAVSLQGLTPPGSMRRQRVTLR